MAPLAVTAPDAQLALPPKLAASAPDPELERKKEALRQEVRRQEALAQEAVRLEAAQVEAQHQEVLRRESLARQEAVQREQARQETQRAEAARQEAAAQAAARQEAQKQAEARQAAARREEALRQEALARQEAVQREQAWQEAQRVEAARQEAAAQAEARQEALKQEAQKQAEARQAAARREAAQQAQSAAAGKSLFAASNATTSGSDARAAPQASAPIKPAQAAELAPVKIGEQPHAGPMESARRTVLYGRTAKDLRLQMVAEGWRQKVEQNAPLDVLQAAKNGPYENPVVTVALRRDGSIESVVINRSSGVPAIDNAVRRIVMMLSPFAPFSSDLAADYDVIEIRRIWTFDTAVRLQYAGR